VRVTALLVEVVSAIENSGLARWMSLYDTISGRSEAERFDLARGLLLDRLDAAATLLGA
jgi:hypothetical protein